MKKMNKWGARCLGGLVISAGWCAAAHPPAGPDRTALWPLKVDTGDRPPSLCMKDNCTSFKPSSKPAWKAWMYLHTAEVQRQLNACILMIEI